MTALDELRAIVVNDKILLREYKREEYKLKDGFVTDYWASDNDITVLIPYPNNRLKAEHRPMRRMRHYGRKKNHGKNNI